MVVIDITSKYVCLVNLSLQRDLPTEQTNCDWLANQMTLFFFSEIVTETSNDLYPFFCSVHKFFHIDLSNSLQIVSLV